MSSPARWSAPHTCAWDPGAYLLEKEPEPKKAIKTPLGSRLSTTQTTASLTAHHQVLAQIEHQNALYASDAKAVQWHASEDAPVDASSSSLSSSYTSIDSAAAYTSVSSPSPWNQLLADPTCLLKDNGLKTTLVTLTTTQQGLPPPLRGRLWQALSQSDGLHLETVYGQLCNERSPHERIIQRDLPRTFPHVDMFSQENGPGQLAMRRVLIAYSLYDHSLGYCQGLPFLVGPLLMNMPEPQAFCVLVRLMETYNMRTMYTMTMDGLQLRLFQFTCLLERHAPRLAKHFEKHHLHSAMFASQWFLTLFAYVLPLDLVTRIYDLLFLEGATEVMMRVAIAMLKRSEARLLKLTECEDLLDGVASRKLCAPYHDDWAQVLQDAMALQKVISTSQLDQLEERYRGQPRPNVAAAGNRFGSFLRRRSLQQKKKPATATAMALAPTTSTSSNTSRGCTSMDSPPPPMPSISMIPEIKRRAAPIHHPRAPSPTPRANPNTSTTSSSSNLPNSSKSVPEHDPTACKAKMDALMTQISELKRQLDSAMDQLHEAKMDRQEMNTERDALKMTIQALEHRHHHQLQHDQQQQQQQATNRADLRERNQYLERHVVQLQERLAIVDDDQVALIEKLATLTLDMDDLAQQKKQQDMDMADLIQENKRLTTRLLCMDVVPDAAARRPLSPPPCSPPPPTITTPQRYPWEPKEEHKHMSLPPPPPQTPMSRPPSSVAPPPRSSSLQQPARRSNSLYGRVWHALSSAKT
ncbi:rab-GTPase-TBC domain-containing protein [Gongronella butleri]|nr:rab-GTPase-TBC domain-containing protein [Gongronella butleri]